VQQYVDRGVPRNFFCSYTKVLVILILMVHEWLTKKVELRKSVGKFFKRKNIFQKKFHEGRGGLMWSGPHGYAHVCGLSEQNPKFPIDSFKITAKGLHLLCNAKNLLFRPPSPLCYKFCIKEILPFELS